MYLCSDKQNLQKQLLENLCVQWSLNNTEILNKTNMLKFDGFLFENNL